MKTFSDLGLAEPILKAVSAEGYTHPTPIQTAAVPALLAGQDVLGIAQTGTGKTAAFVLPLLHKIAQQRRGSAPRMCSALILAPTRELAAQIVDNINTYGNFTRISATLVIGGVRPASQIKALNTGVDIVVATPGRLLDHMGTGAILLAKTHSIVIDEADQMLDLGFLPDIRSILERLPVNRHTALFSATMPTQIRRLADDFLADPAEITVAAVARPVERIAQSVRHVAQSEKRQVLTEILSDTSVERTVVFTRTKRDADRVCKHLKATGLPAESIHGDKSQGQRDLAMAGFRSGKTPILVATDVAARGIDIDDISHVVNFDIPNVPEAYVHRIGRTARAGRSGIAISLCGPNERQLLKDIEKLIGNPLEHDNWINRPSTKNNQQISRVKPTTASGENMKTENVRSKVERTHQPNRIMSPRAKTQSKQPGPDQPLDGLMRMFANIGVSTTKSAA